MKFINSQIMSRRRIAATMWDFALAHPSYMREMKKKNVKYKNETWKRNTITCRKMRLRMCCEETTFTGKTWRRVTVKWTKPFISHPQPATFPVPHLFASKSNLQQCRAGKNFLENGEKRVRNRSDNLWRLQVPRCTFCFHVDFSLNFIRVLNFFQGKLTTLKFIHNFLFLIFLFALFFSSALTFEGEPGERHAIFSRLNSGYENTLLSPESNIFNENMWDGGEWKKRVKWKNEWKKERTNRRRQRRRCQVMYSKSHWKFIIKSEHTKAFFPPTTPTHHIEFNQKSLNQKSNKISYTMYEAHNWISFHTGPLAEARPSITLHY